MPTTAVHRAVADASSRIGRGLYGVACSGGPDSLALADAAITAIGAAHVVVLAIDHGLSDRAANTCGAVAAWARSRGAAAVVRAVRVERTPSLEAAARAARYRALSELADELGLSAILLGHTARDQAETVLLRIVRGTGPAGLAAMADRRGVFARPLLALPRAAIEAHVRAHGLVAWQDPMNDDRAFARVRVRGELMPMLARENPAIEDALVRLAGQSREWLEVIDAAASAFAWPVAVRELARAPAAVRKRVVARALEARQLGYSAAHLDAIDALVCAPSRGTVAIDLAGARAVRIYDELTIEPASGDALPASPTPPTAPPIPPGHILRAWQPGDRMRPLRLRGHSRKLSDLYADLRVPRDARAKARVLVRLADQTIVWAEHIGDGHPARSAARSTESFAGE